MDHTVKNVILGLSLWFSWQSCCLQCWLPTWALVRVPFDPPAVQFPANASENKAADYPSAWVPTTNVGDLEAALGF